MTGFVYICRLRMIESEIQQTIYRVDRPSMSLKADVETFMIRLEEWKAAMPLDAGQLPNFTILCVDGYDNYVSKYHIWKVLFLFIESETVTFRKQAYDVITDGVLLQMHEIFAISDHSITRARGQSVS